MDADKKTRLQHEATRLHKALIMGIAIHGKTPSLNSEILELHDYSHWPIKALKLYIQELQKILGEIGKHVFQEWNNHTANKAIAWLSIKHDEWITAKQPIWEIGRVYEIEESIGTLGFRRGMECPAYAQLIVQGYNGAAIRHPEYHLARDMALLNNLFLDAEGILYEHSANQKPHCSEHSQSLARSVILTCYNLLESFVSGLVTEFVLKNPTASAETVKKLEKPKDRSLKERFKDVPSIITGTENAMEQHENILTPLFGIHHRRRHAFVHCEPGPSKDKEGLFHETDQKTVKDTVKLSTQAIRAAWSVVYKTDGPRWLPSTDSNGRFDRVDVFLCENR